MQIVIIGAGEVGFHAAKALSEENHDITAVDIVPEKCNRLSENLDVIVVEGNGASPRILHQAWWLSLLLSSLAIDVLLISSFFPCL